MRDYPVTSISRVRAYVSGRTEVVSAAVSRILLQKFAVEGKRGQPFMLTETGHTRLNGTKS